MSLRCLEPRETFHPGIGPEMEARLLHVEQQRLIDRCRETPNFRLWDVGLGAGANVLTAIRAIQRDLGPEHRVQIESFEKTLSPMRFALAHARELGYLLGFEREIETLLERGEVRIGPNIEWRLRGDFTKEILDPLLQAPDAIFYDPYSAVGNAEMWSLENFTRLRARLDPARTCIITNYTASTYLRVTLLLAGFAVGIGSEIDKKEQTTICSNNLEALRKPLDRAWLEKRVRISHSAAPLRLIPHEIAPISDEDYRTLEKLPQFRRP